MYIFRKAFVSDLPHIYRMQDIPHREKVLIRPLPPYEQFVSEAAQRMESGEGHYFVLETELKPEGFVEFQNTEQGWTPIAWGKWIKTLYYACAVVAFEKLGFSKLCWYVKHSNKRVLRMCECYGYKKMGEKSVCNIAGGMQFIAVGRLSFYELTAEEFQKKSSFMQRQSLPLAFV